MKISASRGAAATVLAVAVGGAMFRVSTAPNRIQDRNATAKSVCDANGGRWTRFDHADVCLKPALPPAP